MKCGSCKDANAESYTKINEGSEILEILKNLKSRRPYNPKYMYFCNVCVSLAESKLSNKLLALSDQVVSSFTTLNESRISNTSESSKDEYDLIVASKIVFSDTGTPIIVPPNRIKRQLEKAEKPCPKRFKNPLVPIQNVSSQQRLITSWKKQQLQYVDDVSTLQETASSEQRSSDSIPENEMLLNFEEDLSSVSSKDSSVSAERRNVTTKFETTLNREDQPLNKEKPVQSADAAPTINIVDTLLTKTFGNATLENTSESFDFVEQTTDRHQPNLCVPGPSAPLAKNPRMRQESKNMGRNIQQFFSTTTFSVANYSRSTAG
ncbi:hypothetical protein Bhyg_09017 [Pseudolycoriella hygida]|uniref:Uncharacterized protein n=1 Tax=Pseudolycoriella hygida TaxID=35572 RepID=A0A9Q0N6P3_9DIPT|nr:hypothetical protein Bhyg_09017 [Pseudolycoriella hygida]